MRRKTKRIGGAAAAAGALLTMSAQPALAAASSSTGQPSGKIVGPAQQLSPAEIAAANITNTPAGIATRDRAIRAGALSDNRQVTADAVGALAQTTVVYKFGSGAGSHELIAPSTLQFDVYKGADANGNTVYDVLPKSPPSGVIAQSGTPGRTAPPSADSQWHVAYDSGVYSDTTQQPSFFRQSEFVEYVNNAGWNPTDAYKCGTSGHGACLDYLRYFFKTHGDATGNGLTTNLGLYQADMKRVAGTGWPSGTNWAEFPEPGSTQGAGGSQCSTHGWSIGVTFPFAPTDWPGAQFTAGQSYTTETCGSVEFMGPDMSNPPIGNWGVQWWDTHAPGLSAGFYRDVATEMALQVPHNAGWGSVGFTAFQCDSIC